MPVQNSKQQMHVSYNNSQATRKKTRKEIKRHWIARILKRQLGKNGYYKKINIRTLLTCLTHTYQIRQHC